MLIKKEKRLDVYTEYNSFADIYAVIKTYKDKYKDFTFNVCYDKNIIRLEILYTPGYTTIDAYGVNGVILKNDNKFNYIFKENYNMIDFFSIGIIAFLVVLYVIVFCLKGLKEAMFFSYIIVIALFIILFLFYLRNNVLKIIYKFIKNNMK